MVAVKRFRSRIVFVKEVLICVVQGLVSSKTNTRSHPFSDYGFSGSSEAQLGKARLMSALSELE